MEIFRNINQLPPFRNAVITIGTFDGLHLGHQQILNQLKREAANAGGETVVVSFDPHPRKIVGNQPLELLNTPDEKIALLEKQDIDNLVIVPFTAQFAAMDAESYINDFLVGKFHPRIVIIGYDHRFGKDRTGDFNLLEKFAAEHLFSLIEIPGRVIDEVTISSTRIRTALLNGRPEEARRYLGYDYSFEGLVVTGNKLGRTLGYPTANLQMVNPEKLVPGNGVYAVELVLTDAPPSARLQGMMNIGVRPTVDGTRRMIEVNIFNFDETIYGRHMRVYLKHFLRGERQFGGLDALKEQLGMDKLEALALLNA